jgi:hypothetical protein
MTLITNNVEPNKSIPSEFTLSQINQAIETYRTQYNFLIQLGAALVAADVTIIAVALSTKIAGFLVLGSIFPFSIYISFRSIGKRMIPIVYSAIILEKQYLPQNNEGLISTYLATILSTQYINDLISISTIMDQEKKFKRLRKVRVPISNNSTIRILILLVTGVQIAVAYVLTAYFNWSLF